MSAARPDNRWRLHGGETDPLGADNTAGRCLCHPATALPYIVLYCILGNTSTVNTAISAVIANRTHPGPGHHKQTKNKHSLITLNRNRGRLCSNVDWRILTCTGVYLPCPLTYHSTLYTKVRQRENTYLSWREPHTFHAVCNLQVSFEQWRGVWFCFSSSSRLCLFDRRKLNRR